MPIEYVLAGPYRIEYRSYEEPPLGPHEVRVRTIVSGMKRGTELTLYRGTAPMHAQRFDLTYRVFLPEPPERRYPMWLGSWGVGEVVEIGAAVTRFRPGDRVHGPMRHRPTNVFPEDRLRPLPPGLDPLAALCTDPAEFALTAVHDAGLRIGDRVAVFGLGAIGLLVVQLVRLAGARQVIAVDPVARRRALAGTFGADVTLDPTAEDAGLAIKKLTGKGVDVAIEASGVTAALHQAIRATHLGGEVVTLGYYPDGAPDLRLGEEWHHNRITLHSSMIAWGCPHRAYPRWDEARVLETVEELLCQGRLRTDGLITHHFPYREAPAAYQLLDTRPDEVIKVALHYEGEA